MIKDGLLQVEKIGEASFAVNLIPKSNTTSRPGYTMDPKYITVHNTGNSRKGADAQNHTEYVDAATGYVSWHFTVDDKKVFQELPITENAWHAGDGGKGPGNRTSIGIEICEHEGINWNLAKYNGIKLIVLLLIELGLKPDAVVPHKKWSGKYCPHKILDEGWEAFMHLVEQEYTAQTTKQTEDVSVWAQEAWEKAKNKIGQDGKPVNDGIGAKNPVTEEQLMVFFDRLGLLD